MFPINLYFPGFLETRVQTNGRHLRPLAPVDLGSPSVKQSFLLGAWRSVQLTPWLCTVLRLTKANCFPFLCPPCLH